MLIGHLKINERVDFMCGIVGFWDNENVKNKKVIIKKMADKIKHRGLDGEGYFCDSKVAFGHRRLSILDLDNGFEPMISNDKNLVLIFNGEIYNYHELKNELKDDGYIFKTESDTEVLLYGYDKYREEICSKLRGMFAFVIYDKKNKLLFGARDHFGMKPLYYYQKDNFFCFSSEIKAMLEHPKFKKEINKDALKMYLMFQYSVKDETFFKNVFRLNPGYYFIYKNNQLNIYQYYDLSFNRQEQNYHNLKKRLEKELSESINYHLTTSDVEVGAFLSGGVDSSFVVASSKPNKTFSVGFNYDGFDETLYAKELSKNLGLNNKSIMISADDFFDSLPLIMYHTDEPHANLSTVPLYFLAKLASEDVKVVLSGEGADELFGGYNEYYDPLLIRLYLKLPLKFRSKVRNICMKLPSFKGKNTLIKYGLSFEERYIGHGSFIENDEVNKILADDLKSDETIKTFLKPFYNLVKNESELTKKMFLDFHFWLPKDILLKADKMSMANNLELRTPLLDIKLFALARTIPNKYLVHKKVTKYLFRNIAINSLPKSWAKRRKCGFPVPFSKWLRMDKYYNLVKESFSKNYIKEFFDSCYINKLLDDHYKGIENNGRKIYNIYCFLVWYEQFFA